MEEKKYFLVLDDLFYNLLKTLKEDDIDPKVLTHQEVCNYGKKLEEFAKNKGINIILLLSRDRTYQFYRNNYGIVEDDEQGVSSIPWLCLNSSIINFLKFLSSIKRSTSNGK